MHSDEDMRGAFEEGRKFEAQDLLGKICVHEHGIGCEYRLDGDIDMCDCYIAFQTVRDLIKKDI